jgi:broad specificity phosphatase PhoE
MPARSVTVLLLRHGQSEWNAERRWQGLADSPLTELGRAQATSVAAWLNAQGGDFVGPWTSDLLRASETAQLIAEGLGLGEVAADRRLREADAGEWQGLTPTEIERDFPGWLAAHRRPASFEPFATVAARVVEAVTDLAREAAEAPVAEPIALVIAHSGVIRSLVRHLGVVDTRLPNLGGAVIDVDTSSVIHVPGPDARHLTFRDIFDPEGIVVSGVDIPGEDPGDQTDQAHRDRTADR